MRFPNKLFRSYHEICSSRLVKNKDCSQEALTEFENLINGCQPDNSNPLEVERFKTVKDFYNVLAYSYLKFIRGTQLECTILWTESRTIVSWFQLKGLVYLNYDKSVNKYKIQLHHLYKKSPQNNNISDTKIDLGLDKLPDINNKT